MKDKKKKQKRGVVKPRTSLSPAKKRIFWIITFSLPVLFFLILETSLHIFNYGGNLDLFIDGPAGYENYLRCNPNVARRYFETRGEQIELIKLYGSMELGPIVGLSDLIVDVVDTGNTLKANGLQPVDHIADISSRLVVNKAAMKMKYEQISTIIAQISSAVPA